MQVFPHRQGYLIRLQRGEEIHQSLCRFAAEEGWRGGVVRGLGAVHRAELGFYHLDERRYERREEPDNAELLSLEGNLSLFEGRPMLHAHVVLMRKDFSLCGGHLFRADIAVTGEFSLTAGDLDLARVPDAEVGLPLLQRGECSGEGSPGT